MTSAPSACTANMVHDFTAFPFKITVHAPQLLVSQPTCVPVSPSASRIKCTSSSRDSAAASRSWPLIFSLIISFFAIAPVLRLLFACPLSGPRQSAFGELLDQTLFVLHRPAQIRAGLRCVGCELRRLCDRCRVQLLAAQRVFRALGSDRRWSHIGQPYPYLLHRAL